MNNEVTNKVNKNRKIYIIIAIILCILCFGIGYIISTSKYIETTKEKEVDKKNSDKVEKIEDETKNKLPIRSRIIASEDGLKKILSIDKTLEKYGNLAALQLVEITHRDSTPWTKAGASTSKYQEISDESIIKYHKYENI